MKQESAEIPEQPCITKRTEIVERAVADERTEASSEPP